jgi:hypothetical protein
MISSRTMRALLRSEGWIGRRDSEFGDLIYTDPAQVWERMNLEGAYRIASRRKSDRERKALKDAGWKCYGIYAENDKVSTRYKHPDFPGYLKKQEALALLASAEAQSTSNIKTPAKEEKARAKKICPIDTLKYSQFHKNQHHR